MIEAKRKQEEVEMKKLIEQRKREKEEERIARQRVRDQIEQDKMARKAKAEGQVEVPTVAPQVQPAVVTKSSVNKNYTEAKLQIRLTNGSALTYTFGAKEPLSAVRLYVEMNRTDEPGPFSLMTSFPRKVFSSEDYDKPLDVLGMLNITANYNSSSNYGPARTANLNNDFATLGKKQFQKHPKMSFKLIP